MFCWSLLCCLCCYVFRNTTYSYTRLHIIHLWSAGKLVRWWLAQANTKPNRSTHKRMGFLSSQFVYRMKMAEHKFLLSSYHIGFCGVHNCQFMMRIYSFFCWSGLDWDREREDDMSAGSGSGSGMEQIVRMSFHFTSWYDAHAQFKADLHLLWTLAEN